MRVALDVTCGSSRVEDPSVRGGFHWLGSVFDSMFMCVMGVSCAHGVILGRSALGCAVACAVFLFLECAGLICFAIRGRRFLFCLRVSVVVRVHCVSSFVLLGVVLCCVVLCCVVAVAAVVVVCVVLPRCHHSGVCDVFRCLCDVFASHCLPVSPTAPQ